MDDQNSNPTVISRRTLLGGVAAAAGVMIVPRRVLGGPGYQAPSDTVNIATVGYVHGMGTSNTKAVLRRATTSSPSATWTRARPARRRLERTKLLERCPKAVRYSDFRVMLEKQKDIDASSSRRPTTPTRWWRWPRCSWASTCTCRSR